MLEVDKIVIPVDASQVDEAAGKVNNFGKTLGEVSKGVEKLMTAKTKQLEMTGKVGLAVEKLALQMKILRGETIDYAGNTLKLSDSLTKSQAGFIATQAAAGATVDQLQRINKEFVNLNKLSGVNPFDKSTQGLQSLIKEVRELSLVSELSSKGLNLNQKELQGLARDIERLKQVFSGAELDSQIKDLISSTQKYSSEKAKMMLEVKASEEALRIEAEKTANAEKIAAKTAANYVLMRKEVYQSLGKEQNQVLDEMRRFYQQEEILSENSIKNAAKEIYERANLNKLKTQQEKETSAAILTEMRSFYQQEEIISQNSIKNASKQIYEKGTLHKLKLQQEKETSAAILAEMRSFYQQEEKLSSELTKVNTGVGDAMVAEFKRQQQEKLAAVQRANDAVLQSERDTQRQIQLIRQGYTASQASSIVSMENRGVTVENITRQIAAQKALAEAMGQTTTASTKMTKEQREAANAMKYLEDLSKRLDAALDENNESMSEMATNRLVKMRAAMQAAGLSAEDAQKKFGNLEGKIRQVADKERLQDVSRVARGIGVQMGDVAVSLASGMNPIMVMIQQGDQIRGLLQQANLDSKQTSKAMSEAVRSIASSFKDVGIAIGGFFVSAVQASGTAVMNFIPSLLGADDAFGRISQRLDLLGQKFPAAAGAINIFNKALVGLSTVVGAGILVILANLVAVAVEFVKFTNSQNELSSSLLTTGARIGMTRDELVSLASTLAESGGNTIGYVRALNEVVKAGGATSDSIAMIAKSANELEEKVGIPVAETAKAFADMAKDPVEALIKLGTQTGNVSSETIKYVDSLMRQGKTAEAVKVAQEALADSNKKIGDSYVAGLTPVEQLWKDIKASLKAAREELVQLMNNENVVAAFRLTFVAVAEAVSKVWAGLKVVGLSLDTFIQKAIALKEGRLFDALTAGAENLEKMKEAFKDSEKFVEGLRSTTKSATSQIAVSFEGLTTSQKKSLSGMAIAMQQTGASADQIAAKLQAMEKEFRSENAKNTGQIFADRLKYGDKQQAQLEELTRLAALYNKTQDPQALINYNNAVKQYNESLQETKQAKKDSAETEKEYQKQLEYFSSLLFKETVETAKLSKATERLAQLQSDPVWKTFTNEQKIRIAQIAEQASEQEQFNDAQKEAAKDQEFLNRIIDKGSDYLKTYTADLEKLKKLEKEGTLSPEQFKDYLAALEAAQPINKKNTEALKKYGEEITAITESSKQENIQLELREALLGATGEEAERIRNEYEKTLALAKLQTQEELLINKIKSDPNITNEIERERLIEKAREEFLAKRFNVEKDYNLKIAQDYISQFKSIQNSLSDIIETALTEGSKAGATKAKDIIKQRFKKFVMEVYINPMIKDAMNYVAKQMGLPTSPSAGGQAGGGSGGFGGGAGAGGFDAAFDWFARSSVGQSFGLGGINPETGEAFTTIAGMEAGAFLKEAGSFLGSAMGYIGALKAADEGRWGAAIGTAIGTYFGGGIGATIGNALGSVVDELFRGDAGTPHRGADVYSSGQGYNDPLDRVVAPFAYGYGFNEGRVKEIEGILGPMAETSANILNEFSKLTEGAEKFSVGLAFAVDGVDAAFGGITILKDGIVQFSEDVQGLSNEADKALPEFQKILGSRLKDAILGMDLPDYIESALAKLPTDATVEQVVQLAQSLLQARAAAQAMKEQFKQLPGSFQNISNLTDEMVVKLAELFGGFQNANAAIGVYYENFYSESERTGFAIKQLESAFGKLGITMPELKTDTEGFVTNGKQAREAFRGIVDGLNLTTEEGRTTYAQLMAIAPAFAEVAVVIEDVKDSVESLKTLKAEDVFSTFLSVAKDLLGPEAFRDLQISEVLKDYADVGATSITAEMIKATNASTVAALALQLFNDGQYVLANTLLKSVPILKEVADNWDGIGEAAIETVDEIIARLSNPVRSNEDIARGLMSLRKEGQNLSIELLKVQGRTSEWKAALRALETQGLTPAEIAEYDRNQAIRDSIDALQKAQNAEKERTNLTIRLLELQGNKAGALALRRREEINSVDGSNRSILRQIYALEDAKTAQDAYNDSLQAAKDKVRDTESALKAAEDAVKAAEDRINSIRQKAADQLISAQDKVASIQQEITDITKQAAEEQKDAARQVAEAYKDIAKELIEYVYGAANKPSDNFQRVLQKALGGDQEAMQQLPSLANEAIDAAKQTSASTLDFQRAQAKIIADVYRVSQLATEKGVLPDQGPDQPVEDPSIERLRKLEEELLKAQSEVTKLLSITSQIGAPSQEEENLLQEYREAVDELKQAIIDRDSAQAEYDKAIAALEAIEKNTADTVVAVGQLSEALRTFIANINIEADAVINLIENSTGLSPLVKELLSKSVDSILRTVDFVAYETDLPEDLKMLALKTESGLVKTIDFLVGSNLPEDVLKIANTAIDNLDKTVNLIAGSDLSEDLKWIALTGVDSLSKTVDFILGTTLTPEDKGLAVKTVDSLTKTINFLVGSELPDDLKTIAFKQIDSLEKTVKAVLDPSMPESVRRLALDQVGGYQALVTAVASSTLSPELKRVLFDQVGDYVTNIGAIVDSSLPEETKTLLLQSNSTGNKVVTLSATMPGLLTEDQTKILNQATESVNKTVNQIVTGGTVTTDQARILAQATATVSKTVLAGIQGGTLTDDQQRILDEYGGKVDKIINAAVNGTLSPEDIKLLNQATETVKKDITATVNSGTLTQDQKNLLSVVTGVSGTEVTVGGTVTFDPNVALSKLLQTMEQSNTDFRNYVVGLTGVEGVYSIQVTARDTLKDIKKLLEGTLTVKSENREGTASYFKDGGVFTNSIVDRPTSFDYGVMGEAGPEAIMPLSKMPDGSLGVRAFGSSESSDNQETNILLQKMITEVQGLRMEVRADVSHNAKTAKILDRVAQDGESFATTTLA